MSIPQPWAGDIGYRPRPDWGGAGWDPRDYWVRPPNRIPPAPTFQKWVPPPEQIAFGEAPRDMSRYQALQAPVTKPITPPPPPPVQGVAIPQHPQRIEWALRDYSAYQGNIGPQATPILPIVTGPLFPQHLARPDWTLRDYAANQPWLASVLFVQIQPIVPLSDIIVFGELPRDWTAYHLPTKPNFTTGAVAVVVPPKPFGEPPRVYTSYDLTAHQLVVGSEVLGTAFSGIPKVPLGNSFVAFQYITRDMTPEKLSVASYNVPQKAGAQIAPSAIPYVEPPMWTLSQYQQIQDTFSGIFAPHPGVFPKGLVPYFPIEALIRDVPRATHDTTVKRVPPPPPRVFPTPQVYLEWRNWASNEYPTYQDIFSAFAAGLPIPQGFRVMAVTAGLYGGLFRNPGDVFDIALAGDFSDSTVNYQFGGNEYAPGWMLRVPSNTPLNDQETNQIFFVIPDPKKRTVM